MRVCKKQIRVALYYTGDTELARCTPPYNDGVVVPPPHRTQGVVLMGKLSVCESRVKRVDIMFDRRRKNDNIRTYTFRYKKESYYYTCIYILYIRVYIVYTYKHVCTVYYVYNVLCTFIYYIPIYTHDSDVNIFK